MFSYPSNLRYYLSVLFFCWQKFKNLPENWKFNYFLTFYSFIQIYNARSTEKCPDTVVFQYFFFNQALQKTNTYRYSVGAGTSTFSLLARKTLGAMSMFYVLCKMRPQKSRTKREKNINNYQYRYEK